MLDLLREERRLTWPSGWVGKDKAGTRMAGQGRTESLESIRDGDGKEKTAPE